MNQLASMQRRQSIPSLVIIMMMALLMLMSACSAEATSPVPIATVAPNISQESSPLATLPPAPTTVITQTYTTGSLPLFVPSPAIVPNVPLQGTPTISLTIGQHDLTVELASTIEQRQRGLMFRESLDDDVGMLFVFPDDALRSFWMKDTSIPLSIAFLDGEGRILNILDMAPFDTSAYFSAGPARYALEVNQGWFAQRAITPGMYCEFVLPPDLPIE